MACGMSQGFSFRTIAPLILRNGLGEHSGANFTVLARLLAHHERAAVFCLRGILLALLSNKPSA